MQGPVGSQHGKDTSVSELFWKYMVTKHLKAADGEDRPGKNGKNGKDKKEKEKSKDKKEKKFE